MFIAWSDADADWVEKIEKVSSCECEFVFNPLDVGVIIRGMESGNGNSINIVVWLLLLESVFSCWYEISVYLKSATLSKICD